MRSVSFMKKSTKDYDKQIKTAIKRFEAALAEGNMEAATENFKYAQKKIHQIAAKGTLHKNAAARKVSHITKAVNAMA